MIVALYKTFDGEEFISASLASIYPCVDRIVLVHSDTSWSGVSGNRVQPVVANWRRLYDGDNKIVEISINQGSQEDQYRAGIEWIESNVPNLERLLVIDADEVWDTPMLRNAIAFVRANCKSDEAVKVPLIPYVKTPFYRVQPIQGEPTVFLRTPRRLLESPRAWNIPEAKILRQFYFHHFTLVRRDESEIRRKIAASCAADKGESLIDQTDWFRDKWNNMPFVEDFHPFKGRESFWHSIATCWVTELPASVQNDKALIADFLPFGEIEPGEPEVLLSLAHGADLAVELGTLLGYSAVLFSLQAKRVVTVDLFEDVGRLRVFRDSKDADGYLMMGDAHPHPCAQVARFLSRYSNIEVRKNATADEAGNFPNHSVDLLFIDADHSAWGVRMDYHAWYPKVKRGGKIVFHDCNSIHPGVLQFVEKLEAEESMRLVRIDLGAECGSLRAFTKTD